MPWNKIVLVFALFGAARARAGAGEFIDGPDVRELACIAVQDRQVVKTLDSVARQTIAAITGRETLDGQPPVFSLLDMGFRPHLYADRKIIRIRNVAVRQALIEMLTGADVQREIRSNRARLTGRLGAMSTMPVQVPEMQDVIRRQGAALDSLVDPREQERILREGTISLAQYELFVKGLLKRVDRQDVRLAPAVGEARSAAEHLVAACDGLPLMVVPPPPGGKDWLALSQIVGNSPGWAEMSAKHTGIWPTTMPGYDAQTKRLTSILDEFSALATAWSAQDAQAVGDHGKRLSQLLEEVNPAVYPPLIKRKVEVAYNGLAKCTIPGFACYGAAMVLFLLASGRRMRRLWIVALGVMTVAVAVHTAAIGIRWWLSPPERVPFMNLYESILAGAWFGAVVGLVIEWWRRGGIFGAAASFVGWLALLALWGTPLLTGVDLGSEIEQPRGVLVDFWLYVHVNLTIAAYALIAMSCMVAIWWLVRHAAPARAALVVAGGSPERGQPDNVGPRAELLQTLDSSNVIILQLAVLLLGAGIATGAVWADHAWGRPWGWDPKETFALVTWVIYVVVAHVRLVTKERAWWTAVLAIVGFAVMLFTWFGVSFLKQSLHSYA